MSHKFANTVFKFITIKFEFSFYGRAVPESRRDAKCLLCSSVSLGTIAFTSGRRSIFNGEHENNKNSASAEVADRKMFVNKTRKHETSGPQSLASAEVNGG